MRSAARRFVGVAVIGLTLLVVPVSAQDSDAGARCDALAASPFDAATPKGAGVLFDDVNAAAAIAACSDAVALAPEDAKRLYQLGRSYDIAERFDDAITYYGKAADRGYALAFNALGALHESGLGVDADPVEAARLYQRAVDADVVVAMENLGKLYEDGRGVAQDYARAAELYEAAAKTGSAYASGSLGWLTENGLGVEKDDAEAVRLYTIAADGGEAFAQNNLGLMYAHGRGGLVRDTEQAIRYFLRAAEQNWAPAYMSLAWHYGYGEGVDKDLVRAEDYLRLAIAQDDAKARGDAQNELAWLFAMENIRLDEAEALARQSVEAGPEIANRVDTLAWVLHLGGRNKEALALAEKAVALDSSDTVLAEHLAAITAALGK